ncbi:hypothetical protein [Cerasicoccus frondis]|uniref:hypothetical protein n=1 Tax=Cerasicoccus frondis TaxID=490090 RepID=UPI002852D117|nr:hypothetical protein [Cerasicoccus frondis]
MSSAQRAKMAQWAPALIALIICGLAASNLPEIWRADVYARGGVFIFIAWLGPLLWVALRSWRRQNWQPDFLLLALSLLACLVGILGSLNVARHVALALALGGQVSGNVWKWMWLAGMLSWLPATGWLAKDLPVNGWALRCMLLVFSLGLSFRWWKGARA